jgi:hypothetical protein
MAHRGHGWWNFTQVGVDIVFILLRNGNSLRLTSPVRKVKGEGSNGTCRILGPGCGMLIDLVCIVVVGWQNLVAISGIDCADEANVPTCREYEIMGYPSLRFFGANSPEEKVTFVWPYTL